MRLALMVAAAAACGCAADFVHLVKDSSGVWWLQHNGRNFFSTAVNHVNNGGQDDGVDGRESVECKAATNISLCGDTLSFSGQLGFAPFYNVTQAKYGPNETVWAEAAIARIQSWGFNTISGWSARVAEKAAAASGVYYAHLLDIGVTWLQAWSQGLDPADVWSANFSAQAETVAATSVPPRANDEYLLGWQLDNEINWNQVGLVRYIGQFDTSAPGYGVALAWLQARYTSLASLNSAWNIHASSWSDVRNHVTDPALNQTAFGNDDQAFTGVVAGQYFNVTTSAIRKYDTNHLILGVRFAVLTPQIVAAAAPYIDLFDQHSYDDLPPVSWLQTIYQMTGKPVMVGEFSFTAIDSNMQNTVGARAHNPCTTQTQRAAMWTAFAQQLINLPFCVGYGHWQYMDEPNAGRWPDGENSNYGLVHLADDPYSVFVDAISALQATAQSQHAVAR